MSSLDKATPEGTAVFAAHFPRPPGRYRLLDGLTVSSLGIGTYLGHESPEEDDLYKEAVFACLQRGVNLLDTAINYRAQRSERVIGQCLQHLPRLGVAREQLVVCTKAGFLPYDGTVPREGPAFLRRTYLDSGLVPPGQLVAGCHCMHPAYLEDQIQRSLRNLRLRTIDLFYLHNPETQLQEIERDLFEARLRAAFALCEELCARGVLGRYGVATWQGFRAPLGGREHLSIARLCALAEEVAGPGHHLRAIQLPLNFAMTEAWSLKNQPLPGAPGPVTLLEAARGLGLSVLCSGPLMQGRVLSRPLPERLRSPGLQRDSQHALQFVRSAPGVTAALCGMKSEAHVRENLAVLEQPPIDQADFARRFAE